jgi:hypothetical protein
MDYQPLLSMMLKCAANNWASGPPSRRRGNCCETLHWNSAWSDGESATTKIYGLPNADRRYTAITVKVDPIFDALGIGAGQETVGLIDGSGRLRSGYATIQIPALLLSSSQALSRVRDR